MQSDTQAWPYLKAADFNHIACCLSPSMSLWPQVVQTVAHQRCGYQNMPLQGCTFVRSYHLDQDLRLYLRLFDKHQMEVAGLNPYLIPSGSA